MITTTIDTLKDLEDFDLYGAIHANFNKAWHDKRLFYEPSDDTRQITEPSSQMTFQLSIVNGLGHRPHNRPAEVDEKNLVGANNQFANPDPELTVIGSLLGDYRIILNKYPNSEDHFLLVTKDFVPQDTLLKPEELTLIHTILKVINSSRACQDSHTRFFSFFNSGPESGYSQFHKHIQFLRLPENFTPFPAGVIANQPFFMPREINVNKHPLVYSHASFKHAILKIKDSFASEDEHTDVLAMLYMFLVGRVLNISKENAIPREKVSYNFMMMDDWMMTVPRRHAKYQEVWQNSLGFMGIFCARNEEIKKRMLELGFSRILEECGFPLEEDEQKITYNGYCY